MHYLWWYVEGTCYSKRIRFVWFFSLFGRQRETSKNKCLLELVIRERKIFTKCLKLSIVYFINFVSWRIEIWELFFFPSSFITGLILYIQYIYIYEIIMCDVYENDNGISTYYVFCNGGTGPWSSTTKMWTPTANAMYTTKRILCVIINMLVQNCMLN